MRTSGRVALISVLSSITAIVLTGCSLFPGAPEATPSSPVSESSPSATTETEVPENTGEPAEIDHSVDLTFAEGDKFPDGVESVIASEYSSGEGWVIRDPQPMPPEIFYDQPASGCYVSYGAYPDEVAATVGDEEATAQFLEKYLQYIGSPPVDESNMGAFQLRRTSLVDSVVGVPAREAPLVDALGVMQSGESGDVLLVIARSFRAAQEAVVFVSHCPSEDALAEMLQGTFGWVRFGVNDPAAF